METLCVELACLGIRHALISFGNIPDLEKDIERLMMSLDEHQVYDIILGREVDPMDGPVPDVISTGHAQLAHRNRTNPH